MKNHIWQYKQYRKTKQPNWKTWKGYFLQSIANVLLIVIFLVDFKKAIENTIAVSVLVLMAIGCYLTRAKTNKEETLNRT